MLYLWWNCFPISVWTEFDRLILWENLSLLNLTSDTNLVLITFSPLSQWQWDIFRRSLDLWWFDPNFETNPHQIHLCHLNMCLSWTKKQNSRWSDLLYKTNPINLYILQSLEQFFISVILVFLGILVSFPAKSELDTTYAALLLYSNYDTVWHSRDNLSTGV